MSEVPYTYQRQFRKSGREVFISFVLGVGLTLFFTCQLYGWLLGHHSNLGAPIIWVSPSINTILTFGIIGAIAVLLPAVLYKAWGIVHRCLLCISLILPFYFGALYNPFREVLWLYSYWNIPEMQWVHQQVAIIGLFYLIGTIYFLVMSIPRKNIMASGAYGTAKLETADKFKAGIPQTRKEKEGTPFQFAFIIRVIHAIGLASIVKPYHQRVLYIGIILGRHYQDNSLLFYRGDRHLMAVAPTRSGKGTGLIVTNALTYTDNFFAVDPKGEICSLSWKRREEMGQDVYCLDPWRQSTYAKTKGSHGFNPLDYVPASGEGAYDKCAQIAQCIVTERLDRGDSHWLKAAKSLTAGLILYVCRAPKYNDPSHEDYIKDARNLLTVFVLLNQPQRKFDNFIKRVIRSDELEDKVKSFAHTISKKAEKELSGVISTAEENFNRFIHSDALGESLMKSDFNIDKALQEPSSLYIIVPDDKIETYKSWLRLVVNTILDRAVEIKETVKESTTNDRTLIILDEFKALGYLKKIEKAYTTLAGYGFNMWIFTQNIANIKNLYRKEWRTFKANSAIFQAFNANDYETAKYISDEGGKTTILTESESENRLKGDIGINHRSGDSTSIREQGRQVLTPDEVKRLPDSDQLILPIGENISLAKKIEYFNDPYFDGLYATQKEIDKLNKEAKLKDPSLSKMTDLPIYDIDFNTGGEQKENQTENESAESKAVKKTTDEIKDNLLRE